MAQAAARDKIQDEQANGAAGSSIVAGSTALSAQPTVEETLAEADSLAEAETIASLILLGHRSPSVELDLREAPALSLYSPMQPRRDIAENSAPAAGWICGTFSRGLPGSEKPPQLVGYELRRSGVTDFLGAMRVDSHHHHEQQQRHHHQHPQAADTTSGLRYTSKRPWVLGGLPSPFS